MILITLHSLYHYEDCSIIWVICWAFETLCCPSNLFKPMTNLSDKWIQERKVEEIKTNTGTCQDKGTIRNCIRKVVGKAGSKRSMAIVIEHFADLNDCRVTQIAYFSLERSNDLVWQLVDMVVMGIPTFSSTLFWRYLPGFLTRSSMFWA